MHRFLQIENYKQTNRRVLVVHKSGREDAERQIGDGLFPDRNKLNSKSEQG